MDRKEKLLIITIILGLTIIFFLSNTSSKILNISEIKKFPENKKVSLIVEINNKVIVTNNFTILKLNDETGTINGICKCTNLENGKYKIEGKISLYEKEKQISVDKVKNIKS